MNKNRFGLGDGVVDEVEDEIGGMVCVVEEHLVLLVQPLKRQVLHSNCLPMVWNLLSSAVDDMSDLVCHHELQILEEVISGKKRSFTWAANSSPMKSPSFILIAPIISSSIGGPGGI